jgi:hyperosmotically inducible protein
MKVKSIAETLVACVLAYGGAANALAQQDPVTPPASPQTAPKAVPQPDPVSPQTAPPSDPSGSQSTAQTRPATDDSKSKPMDQSTADKSRTTGNSKSKASSSTTSGSPDADNTRNNATDRNSNKPTADNAKNNTSDRDTMQKIRKAIMADKTLSTNAHNVKVISQHGQVTLRGVVNSDEEKSTVERLATDVAGSGTVTNSLTVKSTVKKGTN